jgi:hypothetical protein
MGESDDSQSESGVVIEPLHHTGWTGIQRASASFFKMLEGLPADAHAHIEIAFFDLFKKAFVRACLVAVKGCALDFGLPSCGVRIRPLHRGECNAAERRIKRNPSSREAHSKDYT